MFRRVRKAVVFLALASGVTFGIFGPGGCRNLLLGPGAGGEGDTPPGTVDPWMFDPVLLDTYHVL